MISRVNIDIGGIIMFFDAHGGQIEYLNKVFMHAKKIDRKALFNACIDTDESTKFGIMDFRKGGYIEVTKQQFLILFT